MSTQKKQRILYFYQYFSTPKGSWGTRVYEFAKEWVERGHEVTVVTSIYSKSDLKAEKFLETQLHEGIKVKIINVRIDNKQSFLKRISTFLLYSLLSCWYALTLKADIVIASSGPITVGLPGLIAKIFRGRKLVFEVRDLWPEGAIELGIIKNTVIQKVALWFEKQCYNHAKLVVALSPGMVKNITTRFPKVKAVSVPNSANIKLFSEPKPSTHLPAFYGDKKVAIYTGNIGMVNNSELLLRAAIKLKELGRDDIIILLVGEGQQKEQLAAESRDIETLQLLGLMPKENLVALVQNALVSLVPLKGSPVLDTSSPNKLFESLAAGVPVIQTTKGWIKDFIDETNCGMTVSAENEDELVEALIDLADHPDKGAMAGQKGKVVAQKEFDKDFLAKKMIEAIENISVSQQ